MKKHREFPNFVAVSSVDVDSGSIWIGDPCYVIRDRDEARPSDLGNNWHDICDRFFERSGYNERQREWHEHMSFTNSREWIEFVTKIDSDKTDKNVLDSTRLAEAAFKERIKNASFDSKAVDKGFANFTHDGGHGGMGTMLNTFYGDGSYPVYIEYGEGGRPRRVLIDFDPSYEDEDGND